MPEGKRSVAEDSAGPTLVHLKHELWFWWLGLTDDYCNGLHMTTEELLTGSDLFEPPTWSVVPEAHERLLLASLRLLTAAKQ